MLFIALSVQICVLFELLTILICLSVPVSWGFFWLVSYSMLYFDALRVRLHLLLEIIKLKE